MRHLLTAIITVILFTAAFMALSDNRSDSEKDYQIDLQRMSDSVSDGQSTYYGDTLYQYDGKTVVYDYFTGDDEEVSSLSASVLITYMDTVPVDTCRVIGNGVYVADGPVLKFAIGVDTVRYDMRHLPDSVNPIKESLPSGTVEHYYTRGFELTDSSWRCDFKFLAYLPANHPTWLNQFIATIMRNDIQALYLDDKGMERILNSYYGIKSTPKKVDGINAADMTPTEIARHFALVHEQLYRSENTVEDWNGVGPKYDYMLEISPAWTSPDGRYVTYRFYSYYYTMGAHGLMEEYYLTFNEETGDLLGYEDIIGAESFPDAIKQLEEKLTAKEAQYREMDEPYLASMSEDDLEANASEIIKEVYNGSYYPRPALTNEGVVFSYQPYEKGSFAEGILHFVIPYSKLRNKIVRQPVALKYPIKTYKPTLILSWFRQ